MTCWVALGCGAAGVRAPSPNRTPDNAPKAASAGSPAPSARDGGTVASRSIGQDGLAVGAPFVGFALPALSVADGRLSTELQRPSVFVGPEAGRPSRALVVAFFATWCRPCFTRELPELARLQSEYGPAGLRVLAVNVRGPGESLDEAVQQTQLRMQELPELGFPLLFDRTTQTARSYLGDRAQLPASFVLDATGQVVLRSVGADPESLAALEGAIEAQVGPQRPPR